ncbi:MAG: lactate utilization protein [Candidatus Hydrogenedentes bacterium]|nr:lactate utilization protein [Candidatus Hydrogenedentota bacterium]
MELTERFTAAFTGAAGHVHNAPDWDAAMMAIASVIAAKEAALIATAQLPEPLQERIRAHCAQHNITLLEEPHTGDRLPERIDGAAIGITGIAFGVALSGTLVEISTNDATRLVSSLPRTHIGVVHARELVSDLREAAARLRTAFEDRPEGVVASLISGPSRTGDIELILTLGVHGPEDAHAVILTGEHHAG